VRVVAGCLLLAASLSASALQLGASPVQASLVAEADAIAPGRPFTLALRLQHAPGWHSYWVVPGDSGLPTRVAWRLPPGIQAGPIQWPAPRRLPIGPLVDYGYEGDTLLLTQLQASADLKAGAEAPIEARAQWLMCHDVCIPGSQELRIVLPVRDAGAVHPGPAAQDFARARARIPPSLALTAARAARAGTRVTLAFAAPAAGPPRRLEFFPLEAGRIEPSAPQTLRTGADGVLLELTAAQPVAPDFRRLRGVLQADGGPEAGGWFGAIDVPLSN
jgi:DsbC/DsbD-like thiol-disulfide interchange protein